MISISGGIITELSNSSVSFKLKCELCGEIEFSETRISITKGITDVFLKKCPSCGTIQKIMIKENGGLI